MSTPIGSGKSLMYLMLLFSVENLLHIHVHLHTYKSSLVIVIARQAQKIEIQRQRSAPETILSW